MKNKILWIATLKKDKASINEKLKYANYGDVFLFELVIELPENTGINKYNIKLENGNVIL